MYCKKTEIMCCLLVLRKRTKTPLAICTIGTDLFRTLSLSKHKKSDNFYLEITPLKGQYRSIKVMVRKKYCFIFTHIYMPTWNSTPYT